MVEEAGVPGENHRPGADPGFQVRGAHLNKLRRAEGDAKIFGVFRVKNHDFTPKIIFFSNFRGRARRVRPPLDPPQDCTIHYIEGIPIVFFVGLT